KITNSEKFNVPIFEESEIDKFKNVINFQNNLMEQGILRVATFNIDSFDKTMVGPNQEIKDFIKNQSKAMIIGIQEATNPPSYPFEKHYTNYLYQYASFGLANST